jgi:hypothetical protein
VKAYIVPNYLFVCWSMGVGIHVVKAFFVGDDNCHLLAINVIFIKMIVAGQKSMDGL